MGDLVFDCLGAAVQPHAAVPTLSLRLRVSETTGLRVGAVALTCQVRIQPQQRRYSPAESERLYDLFGRPDRFAETVKPMLFSTLTVNVPAFTGSIDLDLAVPCSYDLEVAAGRYFHALDGAANDGAANDGGEIPLLLLFSGTVFVQGPTGLLIEPVPWQKECSFRLPVRLWREMVDLYFPDSGWLVLRRETLDALGRFKSRHALPTWNDTVLALLSHVDQTIDVSPERV
jgi:hypothetical protein